MANSVDEQKEVEEKASYPVYQAEWNVSDEAAQRLDAANSDHHEDDQDEDSGDHGGDVLFDACAEGVVRGVHGKGCEVC